MTRLLVPCVLVVLAMTACLASAQSPSADNSVNRFNRLMKVAAPQANAPQSVDGIHDPASPGTALLQPPSEAFASLPKSNSGNYIDWVKAMDAGLIRPRADTVDPDKKMKDMDLDIEVRPVKGTMPDVVFPHKQHSELFDCAQCHPAIFSKKSNTMSMAAIFNGQSCGVCHGKVAFPVSDCARCHAKPKASPPAAHSDAGPLFGIPPFQIARVSLPSR